MILPMFLLAGISIDGAKVMTSKGMISGAGDLAVNGVLAEYDRVLKDTYGLFAINSEKADLTRKFNIYFEKCLPGNEGEFSNFFNLQLKHATITGAPGSKLTNPAVLKRQIIEYMKYRTLVNFSSSELAEVDLDKIFLAEYITEMFIVSEVEYVLWGNEVSHEVEDFTYKKNLKELVLAALLDDKEEAAMLKRVADLVQINMSQKGFDIRKMYTLFKMEAEVAVKINFLDSFTSGGFIGEGWKTLQYQGARGY